MYVPNTGKIKYIEQILTNLKEGVDRYTVVVGDFNTKLSILYRSPNRKSIRKHWT